MNPFAEKLNNQIRKNSSSTFASLSKLGKDIFFPPGILTQAGQAKKKAHRFNATIGIALEEQKPMCLDVTKPYFSNLEADEIYTYAPPEGLPQLRKLWKEKMLRLNPSLIGKSISNPMVTSALTHGLCLVGDLCVDPGDVVITADKMWGVYRLNFETRKQAQIVTFPLFNDQDGFNIEAFTELLATEAKKREKLIVVLNFPNNPTGYTLSEKEAQEVYNTLKNQADQGTKIVTISDDAYFGLFYENSIKESLFAGLCNLHENILAIKLDGATKESYVWGFRTGFLTIGTKSENSAALYEAMEMKVKGLIRTTVSSGNHASQSILEKILVTKEYYENLAEKFQILKARAQRLKTVLSNSKYDDEWGIYPFNSGYFMCLKLHKVEAEDLRIHLLDKYGIGTIALGKTDLRIAFSCIEEEQIEELIDLIYQGAKDLSS